MIKKIINLSLILLVLFSFIDFSFSATREELIDEILENDANYNQKNLLWAGFLIVIFLFWWFILSKLPKYEVSTNNYVKSISLILLYGMCWAWIIYMFWLFGTTLFISRSETFLQDKLFIISILKLISLVLVLAIGILNMVKYGYKLSNAKALWEDFVYEVKNGDE